MIMEEMIEKIVSETLKNVSGFGLSDQSFILGEVDTRLTDESHVCLMAEYGIIEED